MSERDREWKMEGVIETNRERERGREEVREIRRGSEWWRERRGEGEKE